MAGSPGSFECTFASGASLCSGGKPARHGFEPSESVYLSFYLKFSSNWVGSGKPYHPHMLHLLTNQDDDYVGPSETFLTGYAEVVEGYAQLALQDSRNVDQSCLLLNNDAFIGCNGNFETYPFSEARSATACNGLLGPVEGRDCYDAGSSWYSWRGWRSVAEAFGDGPPPFDEDSWHFVEVYFEMNDIEGGIGVPNGRIRWVQDGQTLISSDQILFRTGVHPAMEFDQFALLPYIGDGSPVTQSFWIDELTVATAGPAPCGVPTFPRWELALLALLASSILIAVRPRLRVPPA